jgi:6-phosphogluconolactonase
LVIGEARRAVKRAGRFALVLAGGQTPRAAYELLGRPPFARQIPWDATHIFWGDERCVDADDPRSNELMAREALLDHVPVPPGHVHPIRCALSGVQQGAAARRAAQEYEILLRSFFAGADRPDGGDQGGDHGADLVLLGLGEDGHTASLFPGSEAARARERWVAPALGPAGLPGSGGLETADEGLWRVTMTAPFINRARTVVFITAGPAKAPAVQWALEGQHKATDLPARLIRPPQGRVVWLLDQEAAALLGGHGNC